MVYHNQHPNHHSGYQRSYGDQGFCYVHRKKRLRADLQSLGDGTARMRCLPSKQCRAIELVVCRKHGRKRNIQQMREVGPREYECTREYECRPPGSGRSGHRLGGRPVEGGSHQSQATVWGPSAAPAGVAQSGAAAIRPGVRRDRSGAAVNKQVWCVKHGKRVLSSQCTLEEECCYLCRDKSLCLSTPLDAPPDLQNRGCSEVLCQRHHTLRSTGFMELNDDKTGYQCVAGHPCRFPTLRNAASEPVSEGAKEGEAASASDGLFGGDAAATGSGFAEWGTVGGGHSFLPTGHDGDRPSQDAASFFM